MHTLSNHRQLRMITLCALYFAQGLPYGFITVSLVAWLAEQGMTTGETGSLLFWVGIPWSIKFLWGPLIDRFTLVAMGRRRPWILFAQAMMAATMLSLLLLEDLRAQLTLLSWIVCAHNLFNAMQDVAVDALAVDLLEDDERGKVNGLMWGSKYLGTSLGGAGLAVVLAHAGFKVALLVQVLTLLLLMLFPLLLRERSGERLFPWSAGRAQPAVLDAQPESVLSVFRLLYQAFRLRSAALGALLALLASIPVGLSGAIAPVLYTQVLGWPSEQYSTIIGGPGMICGLIAALGGGWLVDRFGARAMIGVGLTGGALSYLCFGLGHSMWSNTTFVILFLCAEQLFLSLATVGKFSLFMKISWGRVAGTQFTAYMAMINASRISGNRLAGSVDERFEYSEIFLLCGVFSILTALLLPLIKPEQTQTALESKVERALKD